MPDGLLDFENKSIFISGAGGGLGHALVEEALKRGCASVWAGIRDGVSPPTDWESAIKLGILIPVTLEITQAHSVQATAEKIKNLDILVNNAAVCHRGSVLTDPMEHMRHEFEVNYFGPLQVVRAFLPLLKESKGLIVNIGSQLVQSAVPAIGNYCASKSALFAASQALRGDLAEHGVSVCFACPGAVDTKMSEPFPTEKQNPTDAAREIFDAMSITEGMVPVGPQAQALFEKLAKDPLVAERTKARFTYQYFWQEQPRNS